MATARPFAYNTGSGITGTDQVGSLAVGTPTYGFASTGLPWWNGPDEDLGYVIAASVPGNTQPTPVFSSSPLTLSPTYKGTDVALSNGNQTAYQQFGYQQSVLGQTFLDNRDKVMFSVSLSLIDPPTLPNSHFVGFGTTSMNYQGNPYGAFPGNDNQSIGFSSGGEYWFNGAIQAAGLSTFGNGAIIDAAVDLSSNKVWVRVNGGNWNNNPAGNPATGNGSLGITGPTSFYPVLCPGYEGTMTVQNSATYGVPSGYTLLGTNVTASVGFFRSSALTDPSFISIANVVAGPSGGGPFASGSAAKTWLNANGYWTSYVGSTGATGATGAFNVTISQVGPDVVWSGSGSFNLTALTSAGSGSMVGGYGAALAVWAIGPSTSTDQYSGTFIYPTNFGSGGVGVTSNTGSTFGILPGGSGRLLHVPSGYTSNTNISGTSTYANNTIAGMGLSGGTYIWSWGSGANASSLVMVIN
jgi:hypothetical protein